MQVDRPPLDAAPCAWRDSHGGDSQLRTCQFRTCWHDDRQRGGRSARGQARHALRLRQPGLAQKLSPQSRPPGALSTRRYRGAARRRLPRARASRTQPACSIDHGSRSRSRRASTTARPESSSPNRRSARSTRASSPIAVIRSKRSSSTPRSRRSACCCGVASVRRRGNRRAACRDRTARRCRLRLPTRSLPSATTRRRCCGSPR